jgi:DNA polymerase (family X)
MTTTPEADSPQDPKIEGARQNALIAERLRELAAYLRLLEDNPWKPRAYETAADSVEALGDALGPLVQDGRLAEAPGIGPATAAVITELYQTGTLRRLEALRAELPPGLPALGQLPGLTLPRIRLLHATLGISDLAGLKAAAEAGRLRTVKGFGEKTERKLLDAIARLKERPKRLRLVDAREVSETLARSLAATPGVGRVEVAGAVRRWKETVGTIRLVASADEPDQVLDAFLARRMPGAERLEAGVARGWSGAAVEVTVVPPPRFAAARVRKTASYAHLAQLESLGGIDLASMEAPCERAIYRRLGLPEIPAELREGAGEIEAALAGDDFADLVTIDDVVGMIHCHTTHSDGKATVEEMARAAEALGMRYLTITDHSPTASYAGGLTVEALERQWDEIAAVQERVSIRLLRGTESDLLADGALDYPDHVLERFDVIIASIHNRFQLDEDETTRRLVRAMKLPVFKIWGHPLGRLILRRPPVACRMDEVLDAVASSRAAIEINGDPYRLDLPPEHVREARRRGIKFVISTDAHGVGDLENLAYGVAMARRGGVRRHEVLNTLPVDAFMAAVRPAA